MPPCYFVAAAHQQEAGHKADGERASFPGPIDRAPPALISRMVGQCADGWPTWTPGEAPATLAVSQSCLCAPPSAGPSRIDPNRAPRQSRLCNTVRAHDPTPAWSSIADVRDCASPAVSRDQKAGVFRSRPSEAGGESRGAYFLYASTLDAGIAKGSPERHRPSRWTPRTPGHCNEGTFTARVRGVNGILGRGTGLV